LLVLQNQQNISKLDTILASIYYKSIWRDFHEAFLNWFLIGDYSTTECAKKIYVAHSLIVRALNSNFGMIVHIFAFYVYYFFCFVEPVTKHYLIAKHAHVHFATLFEKGYF
jgi:hypothetical protein